MKILLIEDDQPTAAFVEKGLREAGHEVDHSGDAAKASCWRRPLRMTRP